MPVCHLYTSRKETEIKDGIEMRLAAKFANILGKPVDNMIVLIAPGARMLTQCSLDPSCLLSITAIDAFDARRNRTYDKPLKEMLQKELDVPEERCLLMYKDFDPNFRA